MTAFEPWRTSLKMLSKARSIESVRTYVPLTIATPRTIAIAVRAALSLRPRRPLRATRITAALTCSMVSTTSCAVAFPSSLTIRPSARKSVRSAIAVAFGSWETITKVWPRFSTDSRSSARISWLVVESRFPVGSSAKTTVGFEMSARAMATRCCWPPESSDGR